MKVRKSLRSRLLSVLLALSMIVGLMPATVFAAQETGTSQTADNVAIIKSYAAQMRQANVKDDYKKGKFSWDTEGKGDSWRYFNGVMLDAFMMVGGSDMTNYVDAVLSDNISSDGTCANYHVGEVDSVPMALAMFDLLESSANAETYKKAIQYVYTQLEGQTTYADCGGNYLHKQDTSGNPTSGWETWNIGLDGLYMAQPFLMECANAIDSGKLTLTDKNGQTVNSADIYNAVYNRFAWVAETMYDETTGLYHHGWNVSKSEANGHFWGRGIGWYAVALVDVIAMLPASYQDKMTPYLTKLFDGMLQYQDANTGMWYNVVTRTMDLSKNILETSVSSMMAYSLMKAYNLGFVTDTKYGAAGLAAFNGVVANKVTGSEGSYKVADTYLKSGVGTTDEYYTANGYTVDEAKGTGALIMASTQANAAAAKLNNTTDPEPTVPESVTDTVTGVAVSGSGATAITVVDKSSDSTVAVALADKLESGFAAYDITLTGYTQGTAATVTMPAPEGADTVYYVAEDGVTEAITGVSFADGKATFTATHFSTYAAGKAATPSESGGAADSASASGTLPGGTNYVLVTNGTIESGAEYLIVNTASDGTGYALRNNDGSSAKQEVTISNNMATISSNESSCLWTFTESDGGYTIKNGTRYIRLNNKDSWISTTSSTTTVTSKGSNAFWLNNDNYYLRYSSNSFQRSKSGDNTNRRNVYLFKKTTMPGSDVTLTVTPNSASLKPGETINLVGSVLVNGVDAENYAITWSSSSTSVATVKDGVVTAVSDGTATITATLTSANGLAPTGTVQVEILITVTSKTISSAVLTGNDPVTTKKGVEPDFSNIKLTVTYDDNTTAAITTANGLTISGYNKDEIGVYYATISYQGKEYDPVKVTVEGNPYEGLEEATEYPEYPADGAVRIDKTATGQDFNSTGVVKVELDTAGISVKQGVDVVLVVDVSNSMAWSLENAAGDGTGDAAKLPSQGQSTKLDNAMDAADSFAKILLEDNTGVDSDNSVSFVTFAGYDKEHYNTGSGKNDEKTYVDSVKTVFTNVKDYSKAAVSFAGTSVTGVANGTGATYNLKIVDENGTTLVNGGNRGNTNYDYAFYQAQQAVTELQGQYTDYANSGRTTYIVFMTDGAPSHYNKQNCNGGSGRDYWPDSTSNTYSLGYTTANWTEYILNNDNTYANALYQKVGGNFYAFGFDLANGGFSDYQGNEETLTQVLAGMVTNATIPVMATSDAATLNNFYETLAHQIKYAGTNAKVTDTIDSNFTLQATSFGTGTPPASIDVTAYDLYTKAETSDNSLIGTRTGDSTVLETVTFNEDGTQAYSNVLGETTNIMTTDADGTVTIAAQYFTYTKDTSGVEKFVWNIGNITDKEVALSFYAYLKGSMEGTCAEGVYYTNEGAKIEYVDINNMHATKEFPKPTVSWGSAITQIEYYLVNENGQPVNTVGVVIPFANRIKVGTTSVRTINWNESLTVNGNGYVPTGYDMYSPNANYTVTASSDGTGNLVINDEVKVKDSEGNNTSKVSTIRVDSDISCADTTVAFGVHFKGTPEEKTPLEVDQIVIDYGKAIQVNVTENDSVEGYTLSAVGFLQYDANKDVSLTQFTSGTATFNGSYGQFTIADDGKVNYQPKKILSAVEKIFVVVKVTSISNQSDFYYMLNELDIIPATIMYYETDFADGVFTLTNGTKQEWCTIKDTYNKLDEVQDSGVIGVNQTYGFDSTYTDDAIYSNGSSPMVEGEKMDTGYTSASFSFTGTGFDLLSRTGAQQGLIQVKIYAGEATEPTKTVKVLNKSESKLELYQIPVVSVNDLAYGTYRVTIDVYNAVTYTGSMESLSRGGEFYFDAIRVYNPIDVSAGTSDAAAAQSAYTADGEANNQIIEVRQKIIDANTYDDGSGVVDNSVVFVDRTADGVAVADYTTIGPNNEVYLSNGQGIAFKLTSTEVPASIDIGAKSADGNAVTLNASLYSMDNQYSTSISETITSSTALFYNLMAESEVTTGDILSGGGAYVCIFNDGAGILSITDLKVAYGTQPGDATLSVDSNTLPAAARAMDAGEEDVPNYDILSASFDTATCKLRKNATMTVVTTDDVKSLVVTDKKGRKVTAADITSTTENGQTTWKVSIKMTVAGKQTYTVTGYSAGGTAGAPASATINVTRK